MSVGLTRTVAFSGVLPQKNLSPLFGASVQTKLQAGIEARKAEIKRQETHEAFLKTLQTDWPHKLSPSQYDREPGERFLNEASHYFRALQSEKARLSKEPLQPGEFRSKEELLDVFLVLNTKLNDPNSNDQTQKHVVVAIANFMKLMRTYYGWQSFTNVGLSVLEQLPILGKNVKRVLGSAFHRIYRPSVAEGNRILAEFGKAHPEKQEFISAVISDDNLPGRLFKYPMPTSTAKTLQKAWGL